MKSNLLFDFSVNKENKTIHVKREFDATLDLVWKAWTTPELLDQWWAPKPYRTETKSMDFRDEGLWLYAMISPENEVHWCKADYKRIEPSKKISWLDAFCDEDGNESSEMPRTFWKNAFSETAGTTLVSITLEYKSLEDLEKIITMGFQEGFTMAMHNLDELLEALSDR